MNLHKDFLGFFLVLTLLALGQQAYTFIRVVSMAAFSWSYLADYLGLWFYDFDIPTLYGGLHVQGAYPTLIVLAICITA